MQIESEIVKKKGRAINPPFKYTLFVIFD